jgi:protease-4
MRRQGCLFFILGAFVAVFAILLVALVMFALVGEQPLLWPLGRDVALVEVMGPIWDAEEIVRQLRRYSEAHSVGAIILRIDSGGGVVGPSQEIYAEVKRVSESGKPVIASIGALGASGAYYIACGADSIMANPGTITGSIGVQMKFPMAYELLEKVGVGFETIKSNEYKDIGSPYREMTDAERHLVQDMIDDVYDQFIGVVVAERGLPREEVLAVADGRLLSGRQAEELGLVDRIGSLEDAVELAGAMVGIEGRPRVVKEKRRQFSLLDLLLGQTAERVGNELATCRLEYRMAVPAR